MLRKTLLYGVMTVLLSSILVITVRANETPQPAEINGQQVTQAPAQPTPSPIPVAQVAQAVPAPTPVKPIDPAEVLKEENKKIQDELKNIKKERDNLVDNIQKTRSANRQYSQENEKLSTEVSSLQTQLDAVRSTAQSGGNIQDALLAVESTQGVVDREEKTLDLLYKIDAYAEEDKILSMDAAKAHYNMGNIYYERGEYEIAAREYYQAVTLMPDDPDAHFNLAYVSSENLRDYITALKHYKMYQYLNPNAKDREFVNKKILEAELHLRSAVPSPLDKKYIVK